MESAFQRRQSDEDWISYGDYLPFEVGGSFPWRDTTWEVVHKFREWDGGFVTVIRPVDAPPEG